MILSKQDMFSDDQVITATAVSDVVDLGADHARVQPKVERNVNLYAQVTADFATGTSLKLSLYVDDDEEFGSATLVSETAAILTADLVAGYQFLIEKLPFMTSERYARFTYTVAGADFTTGKITAGLIFDRQTNGMN